jgi:hypothetical protein
MKFKLDQFLQTLAHTSIEGRLWIVEPSRIRVHESETDFQP